ncbi:hypothetical protein, partial [Mesorhizobium sp. P5_C1]
MKGNSVARPEKGKLLQASRHNVPSIRANYMFGELKIATKESSMKRLFFICSISSLLFLSVSRAFA